MFAIRFRFPIRDFRFRSQFPIPNRDFRFELTWHDSYFDFRFRFKISIPIRDSAISRFHDSALSTLHDFAIPRLRDSAISRFRNFVISQFRDFAILISRFRDFDCAISQFLSLLQGLRPYTVRPAEHGNSRLTDSTFPCCCVYHRPHLQASQLPPPIFCATALQVLLIHYILQHSFRAFSAHTPTRR